VKYSCIDQSETNWASLKWKSKAKLAAKFRAKQTTQFVLACLKWAMDDCIKDVAAMISGF